MVSKGGVLSRVQHLQQRRRRVTAAVGAQLVNLVQQQQRIAAACLLDGGDDAAGHGAHVGLPVTADFRLVVDAAQGDPGHLPVHGLGQRGRDGGLAHAGRPHQADDLPTEVGCQLLHGQELQDAFLYLVQPIVVRVQHLSGRLHVQSLFRPHRPRQLQAHVQVVAQDGGFCGAVGLLAQPGQLLAQLGIHFLRQLGSVDLLLVLGDLVHAVAGLAQLGLDDLQLFPEIVVLLVLAHLLLDLGLQLLLHLQHLDLSAQDAVHLLQAAHRAQLLQDGLLVLPSDGQVLGHIVRHIPRIVAVHYGQQHVRGGLGGQLAVALDEVVGDADDRLGADGVGRLLTGLDLLHLHDEEGFVLPTFDGTGASDALHHHPDAVTGQAQHLPDGGDGADAVQVGKLWIVYGQILLGDQKEIGAQLHRLIQGFDGSLPSHIKVQQHTGKHSDAPQRHGGQRQCLHRFLVFQFAHNTRLLSKLDGVDGEKGRTISPILRPVWF